jgi:hypothetical protein
MTSLAAISDRTPASGHRPLLTAGGFPVSAPAVIASLRCGDGDGINEPSATLAYGNLGASRVPRWPACSTNGLLPDLRKAEGSNVNTWS